MKIEKVNDNQIRCTLTREDLASRQIKLSELAYGTEKAKTLFRDMMRQANYEFGFEAEDIPLMIEAIPLNPECIVLIITKVEDPEELDTRFARFAPSVTEEDGEFDDENESSDSDEVMNLFRKLQTAEEKPDKAESSGSEKADEILTRVFLFHSMQQVMNACNLIGKNYRGSSKLYKETISGCYVLSLTEHPGNRDLFDRVCNVVSEYGALQRKLNIAGDSYLNEHCEMLIAQNAVNALSSFN